MHSIAYADDRIIYSSGKNGFKIAKKLNVIVNKANNMYSAWNLKVNPSKSEAILF